MWEKSIFPPQGSDLSTIPIGQTLPVDPGRVAHDVVELPKKQWHEGILDHSCPDAVQPLTFKVQKSFVQFAEHGLGPGVHWLDELSGAGEKGFRGETRVDILVEEVHQLLYVVASVHHGGHRQLAHSGVQNKPICIEECFTTCRCQYRVSQMDRNLNRTAAIRHEIRDG